jgi:hypothetical protein
MGTPVGGSILSVTIAGRVFAAAADAEANMKLGGFENEVQANGDGGARIVKTRVVPSIGELPLSIDPDAGDQEFLQNIADGKEFVPIVVTFASGKAYEGEGIVSGEFQSSSQSATAPVTIMGKGRFKLQA